MPRARRAATPPLTPVVLHGRRHVDLRRVSSAMCPAARAGAALTLRSPAV